MSIRDHYKEIDRIYHEAGVPTTSEEQDAWRYLKATVAENYSKAKSSKIPYDDVVEILKQSGNPYIEDFAEDILLERIGMGHGKLNNDGTVNMNFVWKDPSFKTRLIMNLKKIKDNRSYAEIKQDSDTKVKNILERAEKLGYDVYSKGNDNYIINPKVGVLVRPYNWHRSVFSVLLDNETYEILNSVDAVEEAPEGVRSIEIPMREGWNYLKTGELPKKVKSEILTGYGDSKIVDDLNDEQQTQLLSEVESVLEEFQDRIERQGLEFPYEMPLDALSAWTDAPMDESDTVVSILNETDVMIAVPYDPEEVDEDNDDDPWYSPEVQNRVLDLDTKT